MYKVNNKIGKAGYVFLVKSDNSIAAHPDERLVGSEFSAIKKYLPLTFCINDGPNANKSIDKILDDFLNELYPKKSQYEK